jgi:putative flippase GtrA
LREKKVSFIHTPETRTAPEPRQFLKFAVLSGGGWLIDCGLLLFLSGLVGVHVTISNLISSSVAALLVFTVSRFAVFDSRQHRPAVATLLYFVYTCCVIAIASAFIGLVVIALQRLTENLAVSLTSREISLTAKVLITPPQLLANFWMSRYLIQKSYRKE